MTTGKWDHDTFDKMAAAQSDFERNFGSGESARASMGNLGGEKVIIIENHVKRAYYSTNIELLKIDDLND